jgi:Glycosyltransferase family 87
LHKKTPTLPLLLTFIFVPTLFLLQSGQIAGLLVLGAALFVVCMQRGYPIFAGVAAVLLAIKPHLAYLLWLAVALDAVQHRRYRIVLGGVLGGVIFTLIPMAFNPDVWSHYFAAYRDHPPTQWVSLTLGTFLRFVFGNEHFWLQFVPMVLGVAWFLKHWRAYGRTWNWAEQMPTILLVSFVTAPYGAWHFDLVLLLIPIWHLAASLRGQQRWLALGLFAGANVAMLVLNSAGAWSYSYAWVAPLVLIAYFGFRLPSPTTRSALVTA